MSSLINYYFIKELDLNSLTANEDVDVDKELRNILDKVIKEKLEEDINMQNNLIEKWSNEQEIELKNQIKKFLVDEKKKSILERLNYLERQEEVFTFFENKDKIRMQYFNKGFPKENPTDIPIEPEESQFSNLFDKHFKHYKKKNKPARLLKKSNTIKLQEESLNLIYNSDINVKNA